MEELIGGVLIAIIPFFGLNYIKGSKSLNFAKVGK
jgi:hypothetical protein